ncbi:SH3 domain-containing protein [Senegalia sp. (in: firmicutes)]|uniref:SH3 domain-containing protein n=2 Tax=Senegalia sp. (in: firmicutes) TaxID=1924098 RepID=UPI003F94B421
MKGKVLILASGMLVFFAASDGDIKDQSQNKFKEILSPNISYAAASSIKDVKVTTGVLNVRTSPTTSSKRISQVKIGQVYTVYEQKGSWYKIKVGNTIGWIHGDYVTTIANKNYEEIKVTATSLNVRLKASTNSYRISGVTKGQKFKPLAEENGWYKINTGKVTGWVHGGYVEKVSASKPTLPKPTPPPKPDVPDSSSTEIKITATRLNVRSSNTTKSKILDQVLQNKKYKVIAEKSGWYKINTGKVRGWVHGGYAEKIKVDKPIPPKPETPNSTSTQIKITATVLNVRSSNSTKSKILDQVSQNKKYKIIAESNGWYKINTGKVKGWVHGGYAEKVKIDKPAPEKPKPEKPQAQLPKELIIDTEILNVRTGPSTKYERIFQVYKGKKYKPLEENDGWYKINTGKLTGWIHGGYVKKIAGQTEPEKPLEPEKPKEELKDITITKDKETTYINENIQIKVEAVGSSNVEYEYLIKDSSGKYNVIKNYSTTNNINYTSKNAGKFSIKVNARIKGTNKIVSKEITVTIKESLQKVDISKDKQNATYTNTPITISALADMENVEYEYLVKRNSEEWKNIKEYSLDNTLVFTPTDRGNYIFKVNAKIKGTNKIVTSEIAHSVTGNIIYQNMNYSKSFQDYLLTQLNINPQTDRYGSGWVTANLPDLDKYLNPENFIHNSDTSYSYDIVGQLKIATATLNVRESNSTKTKIVDRVSNGQVYTIIGESNGWYKIQTSNTQGWVHGGYVKTSYKANESDNQGSHKEVMITASKLNVRASYTTNTSVIDQVSLGQKFTSIEESNGWYKINTGKVVGWVHGGYVKGVKEENVVSRGEIGNLYSIKVDASVLNVRSTPSDNGTLLTQVKSDEIYIVLAEENGWYKIKANGTIGWVSGDYTKNSNQAPKDMYQFLVLSGNSGLSENQLNNILKGKGVLEGQGAAFIEASEKHDINEMYLLSHALLETGYGKSKLATGVNVRGKTVYNMYGIGAIDSNPIGGGSSYAYNEGWFTAKDAIIGGAKFISEKYVNNKSHKQNTLYKMKWNPDSPGTHQYATDIGWAAKQTSKIKELYDLCDDYTLRFEIPKYGVKK